MNVERSDREKNEERDPDPQEQQEGDETEGPGNITVDEPTDTALNPDEKEIDSDRD